MPEDEMREGRMKKGGVNRRPVNQRPLPSPPAQPSKHDGETICDRRTRPTAQEVHDYILAVEQQRDTLRAAIATPEVYAGIITEVLERERDELAVEVERLRANQLSAWHKDFALPHMTALRNAILEELCEPLLDGRGSAHDLESAPRRARELVESLKAENTRLRAEKSGQREGGLQPAETGDPLPEAPSERIGDGIPIEGETNDV